VAAQHVPLTNYMVTVLYVNEQNSASI